MSKRVKIGVLGAGAFGGYHAAKYADHENAELTVVADNDLARARELAQKHNAWATSSIDQALERIDAAVVTTPAHTHADLALKALRRGVHVFVEKPIATSLGDADAMLREADVNGCVLQVGHQERYVFEAAGLFDIPAAPATIDCFRCAPATGRGMDVSAVLDLMVHDLDLVRRLTNGPLVNIDAEGDDQSMSAVLSFANGQIARLTASREAPTLKRRIELCYENGDIAFDFVKRKVENSSPHALGPMFESADAALALRDPLAFGADGFVTAIQNGEPPAITGEDGRAALDWALKIEHAASIDDRAQKERLSA